MESAEKPTTELHKQVSNGLNKIGHPATPQSVNPNDESSLEPIRRDFQDWAGSTFQEAIGGANNSVNDRTAKGRIGTLITGVRRKLRKAA